MELLVPTGGGIGGVALYRGVGTFDTTLKAIKANKILGSPTRISRSRAFARVRDAVAGEWTDLFLAWRARLWDQI